MKLLTRDLQRFVGGQLQVIEGNVRSQAVISLIIASPEEPQHLLRAEFQRLYASLNNGPWIIVQGLTHGNTMVEIDEIGVPAQLDITLIDNTPNCLSFQIIETPMPRRITLLAKGDPRSWRMPDLN